MHGSVRAAVLVLVLAGSLACSSVSGQAPAGSTAISVNQLREHVEFLADEALAGRETGGLGIAIAEAYVDRVFREAGLAPLPGGDDRFFEFPVYHRGFDAARTSLTLEVAGRRLDARPGVDFRPFAFSDAGTVEGQVVYAGYGITAPQYGYDDYRDLDVSGKVVLVLRHEPGENDPDSPFDGVSNSEHSVFMAKARNARDRGAIGMILVTDPLHHAPGDDLRLVGDLSLDATPDAQPLLDLDAVPFLAVHANRTLARELASAGGWNLQWLQAAVDEGRSPREFDLPGAAARITVAREDTVEEVPARNVVGWLPGSDPLLRDEWIVVGAHHDHIGAYPGEGDTVFNGADDNASGVAGVLELAEAFAGLAQRPRRSLVFVTFTGEERGLLGSRAMLEQLLPARRIVFMLNLDMIGRNSGRPVQVHGDGFVAGLRELVQASNRRWGLPLTFAGRRYEGNSDHDAFYRSRIPFAFLFTGTHEDYHGAGDHPSKLDYPRMRAIVSVGFQLVRTLADRDSAPEWIPDDGDRIGG